MRLNGRQIGVCLLAFTLLEVDRREKERAMDVTLGTFNLNNLFGRWNLYVEASPPPTRASVALEARPAAQPATDPPRDWLEEAPALEARPGARGRARLPTLG